MGSSSQRRTHFVAAALPKVPIRALKLGDEAFLAHDIRGFHSGLRHARSTSAEAPLIHSEGWCGQGVSRQRAFFIHLKSAPSSRRLTHFLAAALPKVPIRAIQLGDKTSVTDVLRVIVAGCRRARRFSATTPPALYGVTSESRLSCKTENPVPRRNSTILLP